LLASAKRAASANAIKKMPTTMVPARKKLIFPTRASRANIKRSVLLRA
jgi:hypothetical protein